MFLEEITISNVGLFHKQNTLHLAPPSPEKPIVLIGGLNGSGKTTLLDAIQLALYGRRARLSNRGNLTYEEYLRRSIHKNSEGQPASVTLHFRQTVDGVEQSFKVNRTWKQTKRGLSENLIVYQNNCLDRVLADTWAEYVEELIPVEISQLFFFDGEKIESFANYENSAGLVSRAIHSLLGLDVVNSLSSDLITLERNKRVSLKKDIEKQNIDKLKHEIARLDENIEDLLVDRAAAQSNVDRKSREFSEAEDNYRKGGGSLFDQRDKIENELGALRDKLNETESKLVTYSEGVLPLLLVSDLLSSIHQQNIREKRANEAAIVGQVLTRRDEELLNFMRSHQTCTQALGVVANFLADDRKNWTESTTNFESFLNLSLECEQDLQNLQSAALPNLQNRISDLLSFENRLQSQIVDLERKLAGVPAQDLVIKLAQERDAAKKSLNEAERSLSEIDDKIKRVTNERDDLHAKLVTNLEKTVDAEFQREDAARIIQHTALVRDTLDKFRAAMVARHANRIASLVLDSFRHLLRKEFLVSNITINNETFTLELYGSDGQIISPERLSAGERQLLAISMLWGLARASGRPLPVVIDTPLGRLDTTHRRKLIEDYFPYASHQVILLSTDEEIDKQHYKKLKPYIGHAYRLEFNDESSSTEVKSGYFW
jgi:DNA sulfur modification protein DndD